MFFDRRCAICDKHIDKGAVCCECDEKIKAFARVGKRMLSIDGSIVEVYYVFDYNIPVVQDLLFKLKRSSNSDLFRYAKELYLMAVPEDFCGVVTYCPRSGKNVRSFGYDQVALPCRIMCKGSGGRLKYERIIKRKGKSKEQKKLSLAERKENTINKFKIIKKDIPENILIMDDVVTSGSSVGACIREIVKFRENINIRVVCLASRNVFSDKR